jgi:hypothetical protein
MRSDLNAEPEATAIRALERASDCLLKGDLVGAAHMAELAAHLVESGRPEALFGAALRERAIVVR